MVNAPDRDPFADRERLVQICQQSFHIAANALIMHI